MTAPCHLWKGFDKLPAAFWDQCAEALFCRGQVARLHPIYRYIELNQNLKAVSNFHLSQFRCYLSQMTLLALFWPTLKLVAFASPSRRDLGRPWFVNKFAFKFWNYPKIFQRCISLPSGESQLEAFGCRWTQRWFTGDLCPTITVIFGVLSVYTTMSTIIDLSGLMSLRAEYDSQETSLSVYVTTERKIGNFSLDGILGLHIDGNKLELYSFLNRLDMKALDATCFDVCRHTEIHVPQLIQFQMVESDLEHAAWFRLWGPYHWLVQRAAQKCSHHITLIHFAIFTSLCYMLYIYSIRQIYNLILYTLNKYILLYLYVYIYINNIYDLL